MNPESLRKKRLEEIEQKRKRLEEMKKSRSSHDPAPPASVPQISEPTINGDTSSQSFLKPVDITEKNDTDLLISKILQENSGRRHPDKVKQYSIVKSSSCFTIMPKEVVKYDKECQCNCDEYFESDHEVEKREQIEINNYRSVKTQDSSINRKSNSFVDPTFSAMKRSLSEEEKSLLQKDTRFLHFFHTACLKIERSLEFADKFDIFKNYSLGSEIQSSSDSSHNSFEQLCTYSELSLLGRPIMELKWSPFVAELFLVAYGAKDTSAIAHESNRCREDDRDDHFGVVCLWSRDMHTRAERKFVTSSPVLTVMFHPIETHYVIGGCQNGQIVLWDMKELKASPVQRSNLTGKGHKHPLCGLSAITAGASACEIVSISVDGLLCHWDTARMNDPIITLQLNLLSQYLTSQVQGTKDLTNVFTSPIREKAGMYNMSKEGCSLNVSCFVVGHGHQNQFIVVGNGAGEIFKTEYPFKTGMPSQQTPAHYGLITAIHMHPLTSSHSYKDLFLTASIDWVIKLWNSSDLSNPIYEFLSPTCEYQCDVQWCPVHPGVFVSIASSGKMCLWNLFQCLTEPTEVIDLRSIVEGNSFCRESGGAQVAFNKITWSKDGQSIFIADSRGELFRLKLNSQILQTPHNMEENHFETLLLSRSLNSKSE